MSRMAEAEDRRRLAGRPPRRKRPLLLPLIALLVFVLVASVWAVISSGRVSLGCSFTPADRCIRVLFVGNSYTSVNDLPATFTRLAASGGWSVETTMVAPGGATLAEHAADQTLAAGIAGGSGRGPWTAVILQEQSEIPAVATWRDTEMAPAASQLARLVLAAGARPYLLETWAHRDGLPTAGLTYATMQAAINEAYRSIARQTGSVVVPAGEAWQRARESAPSVKLWLDDGSHPTPAGTYLTACVLYQTVTGSSPVGLHDTAGLDAATAAALQHIAAGQ